MKLEDPVAREDKIKFIKKKFAIQRIEENNTTMKDITKAQEEVLNVLYETDDWVDGSKTKSTLNPPKVNNNAAKILYEKKIIQRRGQPSTGIKKTKLEYRV